jgi:hypothetical protein
MSAEHLSVIARMIASSELSDLIRWCATCAGSAGGGVGPVVGIGAGVAAGLGAAGGAAGAGAGAGAGAVRERVREGVRERERRVAMLHQCFPLLRHPHSISVDAGLRQMME